MNRILIKFKIALNSRDKELRVDKKSMANFATKKPIKSLDFFYQNY